MSGLTDDVEMGTAEEQAEEVVMQDSNYNSPDSDMTHLLDDPEDQHEQQEVDDIAADALMRDDDAGRPEQASSSSSSGKRVDGKGPTPMSTLSTGAADEDESKDLDMQLLLEGMRKKGQQQGKQDLFDLKGTTGKGTSKSKADAILAKGKKMMLLDKMKGGKGNKRPAQPPSPDELLDTHDSNIRGPVIDALKSSPDLQPPVDGNVKEGQHDMPPPKNKTQSKSEDYSQSKKAKVSPSNNNISASSKNKKGPTSTTPAVLDLFQDLQDLKGNNKNSKDNPQDSGDEIPPELLPKLEKRYGVPGKKIVSMVEGDDKNEKLVMFNDFSLGDVIDFDDLDGTKPKKLTLSELLLAEVKQRYVQNALRVINDEEFDAIDADNQNLRILFVGSGNMGWEADLSLKVAHFHYEFADQLKKLTQVPDLLSETAKEKLLSNFDKNGKAKNELNNISLHCIDVTVLEPSFRGNGSEDFEVKYQGEDGVLWKSIIEACGQCVRFTVDAEFLTGSLHLARERGSGGTAKRRTLFEQFATRFRREDYDLDADESSPMETDGQEGNEDEDSVDADEREEKRREEIEKEKRKVFHSMMNLPEEAQNIYDYVIWNNPFPTITRDDVKKAKDMNNSATKWLFALLPKFIASTKNVLKATGKCCITVTPSQALGKMPEKDANGRIVKWTSTWSLKQAAAENSFPNSEELGFDTRHGMHFYKASYGDFRSLSQIVSEKDKQVKAGASYIETAEGHSRVISYMFFNAMKNKKAQKDATLRKNMPKWRGFDEATQLQLPENYRNSISKIKLPSSTTATDSASSPTAAAATIAEENDLSYAEAFRSILLIFAKRVVPRQHKEDGGPPLFSAANGFITDVFPKLLQRHLQPGARRTFVDTWKRKYKCDENGDAAGTNIAKMTGGSKINI
ncbi:unnamed protein product [Amoebophrya sp. A120]|nr:unnamed protein product [Amoebophrya sp. A120]|eukprot:GSA120T00025995001.1